jgi:hypothetical protein
MQSSDGPGDPIRSLHRWAPNSTRARWFVGLLALAGVVVLLVLQLREDVEASGTTLVLVAIGLGLIFLLVMPRAAARFIERLTTVKVAGVEVSLAETKRAELVHRRLPSQEDDVKVPSRPRTGDAAIDVLRVQDIVWQRLRFAHSVLLELPSKFGSEVGYLDILALLQARELLDTDETRLILDLLTEPVAGWPDETREAFLDAAWPFAVRLGSLIFDRHVRRTLQETGGWRISEMPDQLRDHRPDFLAFRDGRWVVAAARVARPWATLKASRKRLAGDATQDVTRRVVIVPGKTKLRDDGLYPQVEVVHLSVMLKR